MDGFFGNGDILIAENGHTIFKQRELILVLMNCYASIAGFPVKNEVASGRGQRWLFKNDTCNEDGDCRCQTEKYAGAAPTGSRKEEKGGCQQGQMGN